MGLERHLCIHGIISNLCTIGSESKQQNEGTAEQLPSKSSEQASKFTSNPQPCLITDGNKALSKSDKHKANPAAIFAPPAVGKGSHLDFSLGNVAI